MRTAHIYIAVSVLKFDVVVDTLFLLEKVRQVWRCLVQHVPHLQVGPLKRLVEFIALGIHVLINAVVPSQSGPMAFVRSVLV